MTAPAPAELAAAPAEAAPTPARPEAPALGGLGPWFGSKRTLAPRIAAALGPHRTFYDLCCGSMAVLLAKPRSRVEVVNDLHGDLVNLARTVQHPALGPALYRRLRRVLFAQAEFEAARAALAAAPPPAPASASAPDPDRAFCYFVASWQGLNGVGGTAREGKTFARRFTQSGGDPARRWSGAVRSIPGWRRRLEGVTVLQCDAIALAGRVEDRDDVAIYVDPPYLDRRGYYLHDFGPEDHARLAGALARFARARVVVSYYAHPELLALYPDWHRLALKATRALPNAAGPPSAANADAATAADLDAPEILLSNRPFA